MARYHLRRKEKEITDSERQVDILKNGEYTTIGLCRNNEPYVVTLNYGFDSGRTALYFHCAEEGLKLDFIRDNPNVCATVIQDLGYVHGKCDHAYRTVVCWGKIHVVEDLPEKKHALDIMLNHLEKDPDPIRSRNFKDDKAYQKVGILRMDIEEITGKESI